MKELRDYQRDAVDAVYEYWRRGRGMRPYVEVPTGGGKSLIIAHIARDVVEAEGRVLVVAHRKELVGQNAAELREAWDDAPIGIYSAGLRKRQTGEAVTFAGIQSVYRAAARLGRVDLVVIDEAHMIPRRSESQYGRLLSELAEMTPELRMLGLTATPYRLDSGRLDEGDGAIFDGCAYTIGVRRLIDGGYLSTVISKGGVQKISTEGVRRRGGEWLASDLQVAAMRDGLSEAIAEEVCRLGEGRKGWMVFASGVDHAEELASQVRARGVSVGVVTGETEDRDSILDAFRRQDIRCLVNCDVLTTGFNAPHVDLIALARATESTSLYVQIVGRGMRLSPDKDNCLLLDYGGNVVRHGPIDDVTVATKEGGDGEGEAPAKECPGCAGIVPAGVRVCPYCDHEFPPPEGAGIEAAAFEGRVIGRGMARPEWLEVEHVTMKRWEKPGKHPTIRVDYACGWSVVSEWICPEHDGYPRRRYAEWCRQVGVEPAATVEEALRARPVVSAVKVLRKGKYDEVLARK
jgi:DNA repair protein RadD